MDNKVKEELKKLEKSFNAAYNKYEKALLDAIKDLLTNTFHIPSERSLNLREIIWEGYFDAIGKYETPRDYPGNYILYGFGLDKDGNLAVDSFDQDDSDREWSFSEYDFTAAELNEILSVLLSVADFVEGGTLNIDDDFCVTEIGE